MRNITVIIGEVHEEVGYGLEVNIANNRNFDVISKTSHVSALIDAVRTQLPQLVFVSVDMQDDHMNAFELTQMILSESPSTVVIMTALYEKPTDLRDAMRAGARDLIALQDFEGRLVETSIDLVSNARKYDSSIVNDRKGKVISFLSANGGVGKSTNILNIASEIANTEKPNGGYYKVLVLDYDLQFGDIGYLSNVKAQRGLAELNEMAAIDTDALGAHLFESPTQRYYVLTAPKTPQYADIIRKESLEQTISLAKKLFDYILIDTPQGFSTPSMVALDMSDLVAVVSSGQMLDVKNLRVMMSTLEQLISEDFPRERLSILLSKYSKNSVSVKDIQSRFNFQILGTIVKNDAVVSAANNLHKTIVTDNATSDVAKDMKNVATRIINTFTPNEVKKKEVAKPKKGLLAALFAK